MTNKTIMNRATDDYALQIGKMIIEACNPLVFKIDGFIPDPILEYRFQLVCTIVGKINREKLKKAKK